MSFRNDLKGNLEFVFKHASHNVRFAGDVADFIDKLRSARKEYCKTIAKLGQDFQKHVDAECLYGTTKDAVEQLLASVQEEAEGQMKAVETIATSIEAFRAKIKDVEKGAKSVRQDAESRMKELEKTKDATKKERDKFVKYHKEVTSAEAAIEKGKADGLPEKKIKALEEKRDHYVQKREDQNEVYKTSVETSNKRIKHFFDEDQTEILDMFSNFEVTYLAATSDVLTGFSQALAAVPDVVRASIDKFNEKTGGINTADDLAGFCKANQTGCQTPTYLPLMDASGIIIKQEGALNARRSDDPAGMERVFLTCEVIRDFEAEGPEEMSVHKGDMVIVSEKHPSGWWYASNKATAKAGFVPSTYVRDTN